MAEDILWLIREAKPFSILSRESREQTEEGDFPVGNGIGDFLE
jgi:hypothetical protein